MAWGRSRSGRRPRGDGTRGPRTSSRLARGTMCTGADVFLAGVGFSMVDLPWMLSIMWLSIGFVAAKFAVVAALQLVYVTALITVISVLRSFIWLLRHGPARLPHMILLVLLHCLFPTVSGAPVPPVAIESALPSSAPPDFAPRCVTHITHARARRTAAHITPHNFWCAA